MNIVPSEWKVLVSLFTNKIKILSHVVNITVHSVSIIWCKLWNQFGWQLLYWNAESSTSHVCHISFQKYTFTHYFVWDIVWKSLFRNVWIFEDMVDLQYLAVPFNYCKTMWSTTVALLSSDMLLCSWSVLPLPLFWLCTLPPCILPLVCWPWSLSGCSSTVRMCYSCVFLCLYMLSRQEIHEMHLWAISENWYIIDWFIFSLLVKVKIHLHNSWQIYKV